MGMWGEQNNSHHSSQEQRQCLKELSPFLFDSIQVHGLWFLSGRLFRLAGPLCEHLHIHSQQCVSLVSFAPVP